MLNNFIYAKTKDLFLQELNAGNILDEAIVFIEDTKEIWNRGHYFGTNEIDPELINDLQVDVTNLQSNVATKQDNLVSGTNIKTINGESVLGEGDIIINTTTEANVQAVDIGESVEDVNMGYATKEYVDTQIGDINSVLESIING